MIKEKYQITGMTCAACQANITRNVQNLDGIETVDVSLLSNQMSVSYDENTLTSDTIIHTVSSIGYGASLLGNSSSGNANGAEGKIKSEWDARKNHTNEMLASMKKRLVSSVCILIPLMYIAMGPMVGLPTFSILVGIENSFILAFTQFLLTLPILLINKHFFISGWKALKHKAPNMDTLVSIGSGAAFVYGIFALYRMAYGYGHDDLHTVHQYAHSLYFESSATILTLVTVGKYLEAKSKAKTSDALGKLIDLAPKTACVIRNDKEIVIAANDVTVGDIVVIRPGESIPVDGIITEGYGFLDQAAITGESIPVEKKEGDSVICATINKNGTFRFQASKVGNDTTLAQIIRMVDEAGNSKAPIARLADKVSSIFVPTVILIAIITAIVWLLFGKDFEFAFSNAISVLVISCPCALGLATPVAIMVGTGKAAQLGILIKSAESLETLHSIDTIVLDKTGTITTGQPSVTDILPFAAELSESDFLALAAATEQGSEHPLAEAIVEYARTQNLRIPIAKDFTAVPGRGIHATIDTATYYAGNMAYIKESNLITTDIEQNISKQVETLAKEGKTPLLFFKEQQFLGIIAVADTIRTDSHFAIEQFRKHGLDVIMLTGDNQITAEAIQKELNISQVIAEVLPTEKEACIRSLMEQGKKVAMVGDGINDAPALVRADVGIAIGAGTDIAIDSADVILMKDSLIDVMNAIDLSKAVIHNIKMNLFWAFFYNLLGIPVAAGVFYPIWNLLLNPMIGSAAMSLSSVCVVTNALRLRFFKSKLIIPVSENATDTVKNKEDIPEMKGDNEMKKVLTVEGMMCPHCQKHVHDALSTLEGVAEVDVNLETKEATVTLEKDVDVQVLTDAVVSAGYSVTGCK